MTDSANFSDPGVSPSPGGQDEDPGSIDFSDFYLDIAATRLEAFTTHFAAILAQRFHPQRHGDWQHWLEAYRSLPAVRATQLALDQDILQIGCREDCDQTERQQLEHALRQLHPWRKGPFNVFDVLIDTEWRSDCKWHRLQPYISDLDNRLVLDVGCGNGYHCWRMRAAGARLVIGIDPSLKFLLQFRMLRHYIGNVPVHLLPLRSEDLPPNMECFDTVFSMGVLYHRRSPFDHLEELRAALRPGGELVLETLVIPGELHQVLVPRDRYAKMPNVWFLPSPDTLVSWLGRAGFSNIRLIDVSRTGVDEQRSTEWMTFQSLPDFLSADLAQTIEGYPPPTRAIVVATRP